MTCRELTEFLMDYLSGTLPADQRAIFDEHVAECPDCVAYLATYKQTIDLSNSAWQEAAASDPATAPEDLVRAILAARAKARNP